MYSLCTIQGYRERKEKFSDIRLLIPSSFCRLRLFHPVIVAWNSLHRAAAAGTQHTTTHLQLLCLL